MSQHELGELLGVSFQQMQKYETVMNRISAARLVEMADAKNVDVGYFLADLSKAKNRRHSDTDSLTRYLSTKEGIGVSQTMLGIADAKVRNAMVSVLKALVAAKS